MGCILLGTGVEKGTGSGLEELMVVCVLEEGSGDVLYVWRKELGGLRAPNWHTGIMMPP